MAKLQHRTAFVFVTIAAYLGTTGVLQAEDCSAAKLTLGPGSDILLFGRAIDADRGRFLAGTATGAYVYENRAGTWSQSAFLTISPTGAYAAALEKNTAVLGNPNISEPIRDVGGLVVYEETDSGWQLAAELGAAWKAAISADRSRFRVTS